ncbi:MAG: hypothetical protein ACTHNZ_20420 [Trinickia sp.]|uniref:hypothetical protein n=1 Tax=Trinickia sp. TaxID=2571163 RepID=UPI003F7D02CC
MFNLRLSSDAPNLQVENEETIEALSARTKALLDRIQQRFSFARSLRASIERSNVSFDFRFCISPFPFPFSVSCSPLAWCVCTTRADAIGYDCRGAPAGPFRHGQREPNQRFEPAGEPAMTMRFLAKASGVQEISK